jgi:hypothetical protein
MQDPQLRLRIDSRTRQPNYLASWLSHQHCTNDAMPARDSDDIAQQASFAVINLLSKQLVGSYVRDQHTTNLGTALSTSRQRPDVNADAFAKGPSAPTGWDFC